jgi:Golgi phosphoprotein 3
MTSAGLSRRRVPGSVSPSVPISDDHTNAGSNSSSRGNGAHTPIAASHAGSAFEGGSKIAYDPRDLEDAEEESRAGGKMPRLTIMEEVLLLGIKDKQVSGSC